MFDVIQTTDGIGAVGLMFQLVTLILVSFAGGVALGRIAYSRSLEIKNSELSAQQARFETLTERNNLFIDQVQEMKERIATASDLENAQSVAKEIPIPKMLPIEDLFAALKRENEITPGSLTDEELSKLGSILTQPRDK